MSLNKKSATKSAFFQQFEEISNKHNISLEETFQLFATAIEKTILKRIDPDADLEIIYDAKKQIFQVFNKNVEVVENDFFDGSVSSYEKTIFITEEKAKEIYPNAQIGDIVKIQINIDEFEKDIHEPLTQLFKQSISDVTRQKIYEKYFPLKDQVMMATLTNKIPSGFIYKIDGDNVDAFMPSNYATDKNIPIGTREEVVIEDVNKHSKQTQIVVSSKSIQIVKSKIIDAIPELQTKHLEIASIARSPKEKCKVAIRKVEGADSKNISEIGSIVGLMGARIDAISKELNDEKLEIIKYDDNIVTFIANSIAPARVICVKEMKTNSKNKKYTVVVPDFQHSLAIGKKGVNVRLASDLTRVTLEILPYSQVLKDNKFKIEWNGNIQDENEILSLKNEYLNRRQSTQTSREYNSDSFDSFLEEFEREMQNFEQDNSFEYNQEVISSTLDSSQDLTHNKVQKDSNKPQKTPTKSSKSTKSSKTSQSKSALFDADNILQSALDESITQNKLIDQLQEQQSEANSEENQNLETPKPVKSSKIKKEVTKTQPISQNEFNDTIDSLTQEIKKTNVEVENKTSTTTLKTESKTPKFKSTNESKFIQREVQNFKSDKDLESYSGVDELDLDLDDLDGFK